MKELGCAGALQRNRSTSTIHRGVGVAVDLAADGLEGLEVQGASTLRA